MEQVKELFKTFVMTLSEILWVYYTIVMFTSAEWEQPAFFDLTWFIAAGVMGYGVNAIFAKRINYLPLFAVNVLVLGFMILENWRRIVPPGAWGFGLAVSIGLSFIFLRSVRLAFHHPVRLEILHCFEGNIIGYSFFVLIFTANKWPNQMFHLLFMCAIVSSLLGMILTLQNHEEAEDNQKTKIIKVGQSGWFAGTAAALLILVPLFSLALFLPSVNRALYLTGMSVWNGAKWLAVNIGGIIANLILWFFGLFPETPMGPVEPVLYTFEQPKGTEPNAMGNVHPLLIKGIIAVGAVLIVLLVIFFFCRLIKNMQFSPSLKPKQIIVTRESWWEHFKKNIKSFLRSLNLKWRMGFLHFYYHPVYWYYHQVLRWGKKKGFPKGKSETSKEYVERIIGYISEEESSFHFKDQNYQLPELLLRLNKDYQAAYYGGKTEINDQAEYQILINHLQKVQ
ncbi:MAG: hypothetical protein AAGU27_12440 [Dehalobacterium sp.]